MAAITDFLSQGWVLAVMGLLLVGLIGLMVFMRMKKKDDE
jgi:LPXTG-motif cell wall-anchored protein